MQEELDFRDEASSMQYRIDYYRSMEASNLCPYLRLYYSRAAEIESRNLKKLIRRNYQDNQTMHRQREFTLEELLQYDGSGGKPAYAAVNGIVYDVSVEPTWGGGTHFGLYSGKDLSSQFEGCHQGIALILSKLPKVGTLKK